jgi:EmrB/QacA subfamily drug resistance transporter
MALVSFAKIIFMETVLTTKAYDKRWQALAILCVAQFMVIMDTSIIGVALPAIKDSLGYSQAALQWIFNAYVIVFGGLLLLGGRLSDLFGARRIFMVGFVVLTGASLLAGMAWSETSMNIGRGLQGAGSALIAPAALTLVISMFSDPKELGKALGFWGASAAAGGSAGVFLGGVITEWLSWRWVFLINIPIGLFVLSIYRSFLPEGRRSPGKVDALGALLVTAALIIMVYAIVSAEQAGWSTAKTPGLLALSVGLLILFIILQKSSRQPLLPLTIFKVPNLAAGNIIMALMAAAWIPLWFFLNLYLQQVLNYSAFSSGLALLPMTLAIMVIMVGLTGKLVQRFGFKRNLVTGLAFLTASLILFSTASPDGNFLSSVLLPSLLGATGMSLAYIPGTIASMSGAKPEETGLASGIVNTSYQIGSALGLAIIVVFVAASTKTSAAEGASQVEALNNGFRTGFLSAAMVSGLATLLAIVSFRQKEQLGAK